MEGIKSGGPLSNNSCAFYLKNVCFSWTAGTKALDKCNLSIPGPGLWMLVGSNGSGKSTLFKLISGFLKPNTGHIECHLKTSLMFQNPDHQLLMPSCRSELLLSLPRHLTRPERLERVKEVLKQVDLSEIDLMKG